MGGGSWNCHVGILSGAGCTKNEKQNIAGNVVVY